MNPEKQADTQKSWNKIDLYELGQYRLKSHCTYDTVKPSAYSVFQIEILNQDLQKWYQGKYILEVWNKESQRVFQIVLKEECLSWKLCNNVLTFRKDQVIHVLWLDDDKYGKFKYPVNDVKEVDIIYYKEYLVISLATSFKFLNITSKEIVHSISDDNNQINERDFSGLVIQEGTSIGLIYNPLTDDLIFIQQAQIPDPQVFFQRFVLNPMGNRVVSLENLVIENKQTSSQKRVDKRQGKAQPLEAVQQLISYTRRNKLIIVAVRKGDIIETFQNFVPCFIGPIPNVVRILPHADKIVFQLKDNSLQSTPLENTSLERTTLIDTVYYKQQALLVSDVNFYTDLVSVNQNIFLLRDNIVFVYDTFLHSLVQYPFKQKVVSLHKLRIHSDDAQGYGVTKYKVVSMNKNGSLAIFSPKDDIMMKDWEKAEQNGTPMCMQKETLVKAMVNQNSLTNIYIQTLTVQNELKLYQLQNDMSIIDLNLKLAKTDQIFIVNSTSRLRELLAICDAKSLTLYKNEKGQLAKIYSFSISTAEIKQFQHSAIIYFQREYLLIINKRTVFCINTRTNAVDKLKLNGHVSSASSLYIDARFFYFITDKKHQENASEAQKLERPPGASNLSSMGILSNDMIEQFFKNQDSKQIDDQTEQEKLPQKIVYPTWDFNRIVKMDFDYFNANISILSSNLEVHTFPLLHRNTFALDGMAERTYYLGFRKIKNKFYAVDKKNFISCWNADTGKLLSRNKVEGVEIADYEIDRHVYDKDWFKYSIVFSPTVDPAVDKNSNNTFKYKAIQINEQGILKELACFVHSHSKHQRTHLYLNSTQSLVIEILINNDKKEKATYNLYSLAKGQQKLTLIKTLDPTIHWHKKTLYPYLLDPTTYEPVNPDKVSKYDLYKVLSTNQIKVLNMKDGMEVNYNIQTGHADSYIALQYSFQNTRDSFYDRKTGQFFIQEVELRLQNYYEQLRKKILLKNCHNPHIVSIDISGKQFKHKYVLEQSYTDFDYQYYNQFVKDNEKHFLVLMRDLSALHIKRFVHNIFPNQNQTILHLIPNCFEIVDQLAAIGKKEGFVLPFLINANEETPLDLAVKQNDYKQANSILKLLGKAPLDHHSRFISNIIPQLIELNLPYLEKYFDKRGFQIGACTSIQSGNLRIRADQDYTAVPTTFQNDDQDEIKHSLMDAFYAEQAISLEVLDLPLHPWKPVGKPEEGTNRYEMMLVKSLSNTHNQHIFQQKSLRTLIDFMWPSTRRAITKNILLPYLALILYYMMYLMVLKKLNTKIIDEPDFMKATSNIFFVFDVLLKLILFFGCAYFFGHDFNQIKSTSNPIVLWSYINAIPLVLVLFIIFYDTIIEDSPQMEKTFYSASAFLIWVRIIHLFKLFAPTAHLLRMGTQILFQMRFLIYFIAVSLISFGFTFYFLSDREGETPFSGTNFMFLVLIGNYKSQVFNNYYLETLLVVVSFINAFFIFTLLIGIAIFSFQTELDTEGVLAFKEKAAIIGLYSYLLSEEELRDQSKRYLLIATITDNKRKAESSNYSGGSQAGQDQTRELRKMQSKLVKSFDRRLTSMNVKFDKSSKEVQDRLDTIIDKKDGGGGSPMKKK